MSNLDPFRIIGDHITTAQRHAVRWAVIQRANIHTPQEAHYLKALFADEETATEYAKTCFYYTGVSHIVKPLN